MKEYYFRVCKGEKCDDIQHTGKYKRIDDALCYQILDENDNLIHKVLNLKECDYVEVWENGICTCIEEKM